MPRPRMTCRFNESENLSRLAEMVIKLQEKTDQLQKSAEGCEYDSLVATKARIMAIQYNKIQHLITQFNQLEKPDSEALQLYYNGVLATKILASLTLQSYNNLKTLATFQSYTGKLFTLGAKMSVVVGAVTGAYFSAGTLPAVAAFFGAGYVNQYTIGYMSDQSMPESLKIFSNLMTEAGNIIAISFHSLDLGHSDMSVPDLKGLKDIRLVYCHSEENFRKSVTDSNCIYIYPDKEAGHLNAIVVKSGHQEMVKLDQKGLDKDEVGRLNFLTGHDKERVVGQCLIAIGEKMFDYQRTERLKLDASEVMESSSVTLAS